MKSQRVAFLEFVEDDLLFAADFYDSWMLNGADVFMERFRETVAWIEWNPEMFPRKHRHFRRAIIRRTFFAVYFAVGEAEAIVVAILDMRRDPRSLSSLLRWRLAARGE